MTERSTRWVFNITNYNEELIQHLNQVKDVNSNVIYMAYGFGLCNKTKFIKGYIVTNKRSRPKAVCVMLTTGYLKDCKVHAADYKHTIVNRMIRNKNTDVQCFGILPKDKRKSHHRIDNCTDKSKI